MNALERPTSPLFRDAEHDAQRETCRARERTPLHVLVVEDSENDVLLLLHGLSRVGYEPLGERAEASEKMVEALGRVPWNMVVGRHRPLVGATEASTLLRQKGLDTPFVSVSARSMRTRRWRA